MKKRKCYLFVFDGFSDWEPGLTVAALQKYTDFEVLPFSTDGRPVRSMGNVTVQPVIAMNYVKAENVDLLLLPGGDEWDQGGNLEIKPLLNAVLDAGGSVAAICGATGFLAEQGFLDHIRHTSNHLNYYLGAVAPHYKGSAHYIKKASVRDGQVITANGMSPVAFAEEILNHFDLLRDEEFTTWFNYFKHPELAFS